VRWTRNDPDKRFLNAETAAVDQIGRNTITFENAEGERFKVARNDPALRHIDHGWTHTLHAMQGQTVDHIIAVMDASNPQMTTEKAFYVALSRARDGVTIVTEDVAALKETLEHQSGVQLTAHDVAKDDQSASLDTPEADASDHDLDVADDAGLDRDMEMGM
jgi:ATP-dependent exoDNAse (exonuclease V) alpha subunit